MALCCSGGRNEKKTAFPVVNEIPEPDHKPKAIQQQQQYFTMVPVTAGNNQQLQPIYLQQQQQQPIGYTIASAPTQQQLGLVLTPQTLQSTIVQPIAMG